MKGVLEDGGGTDPCLARLHAGSARFTVSLGIVCYEAVPVGRQGGLYSGGTNTGSGSGGSMAGKAIALVVAGK